MKRRTPSHPINLQDDYKRIEQLALYMKKNKMNAQWLDDLRKTIYVDDRY